MTSSGDPRGLDPTPEGGPTHTLAIRSRGDVLLVGVRVVPSAPRTEIRGTYGDRLKVAVCAAPEGGKANARLVQALAGWLDIRLGDVRVESGHSRRDKVVAFSGTDEGQLRERLDRLIRSAGTTGRVFDGS